jgi:acetoacetate decarboxylase
MDGQPHSSQQWSQAHSTPWDAPLVASFPFEMRDVEILTVFYRTDPSAIQAILPDPLVARGDVVAIHIYKMNDTDYFGAYNESAIQVGAALPDNSASGAFSPYLFLDSDGAVAAGREVYGQPKKFGVPKLSIRQDTIVGTVKRNGIRVLRVTTAYKQKRAEISEATDILPFVTNLNYKLIPDVSGEPAIRQITARELLDVTVKECWRGPATVEMAPHIQAPVHRLPVREMLDGFYWRSDFTLGPGRVVHDYLQQ